MAKAEWEHTVAVLREMNLLSSADQTTLAMYCDAVSLYHEAATNVKKFGAVILSPNKNFPMPSPWQSTMRQAMRDALSLADRFGLSPSARARLAIESKPEAEVSDKWKMVS